MVRYKEKREWAELSSWISRTEVTMGKYSIDKGKRGELDVMHKLERFSRGTEEDYCRFQIRWDVLF